VDYADSVLFNSPGGPVTLLKQMDCGKFSWLKLKVTNFARKIGPHRLLDSLLFLQLEFQITRSAIM
jgi:hypothetical protein